MDQRNSDPLSSAHLSPKAAIADGNPWYTESQLDVALGTKGNRFATEARWRQLDFLVSSWLTKSSSQGGELRILDAGCGDGLDLNMMGGIFAGAGRKASLYGCDYNPLRLAVAGKNPAVKGVFLTSLAETPIAPQSFDVILCNHVIEHIEDTKPALRELGRMLRPGGMLIVGVPNEGCMMARLRNHVLQRSIMRTTDHVHFFTAATLGTAISNAGMRAKSIVGYGFFPPHLRLNNWMWGSGIGRVLLKVFGAIMPGQSADLLCVIEAAPAELK
jgi:2-polyprenyl-3-methyl-5-hydroxy-6-metoxy-1,4-benzoquinol methylase